jgi:hypothetical protein
MTAVNGDGVSKEHLIRQVAKRLSPELRAEYYRILRHCRALPDNDEMLVLLNAIHLLPSLTIDVPGQMASEREKMERLLRAAAEDQKEAVRLFREYQAKLDQRLASLPQEIAKLIQPSVIAAMITESLRQQFAETTIPETAKILRTGAEDIKTATLEFRSGLKTVLGEANGFLAAVRSACQDALERVGNAAQRIAAILEGSVGSLILLAGCVGVVVGLGLGILLRFNLPRRKSSSTRRLRRRRRGRK